MDIRQSYEKINISEQAKNQIKNDILAGEKTVRKEIYRLIIPMILENLLQVSAGLISTAMIGRLMASDISAQGICVRITDTLWC